MQLKAKEVLDWHPLEGRSYFTEGSTYLVVEGCIQRGICCVLDDYGRRTWVSPECCAHGVIWEVVDAS